MNAIETLTDLLHVAESDLSNERLGAHIRATNIHALLAEMERLQAIVDKLMVTADGVRVTTNMPVWCVFRGGIASGHAMPCDPGRVIVRYDQPINLTDDENWPVMTDESDPSLSVVFATREAAEQAARKDGDK